MNIIPSLKPNVLIPTYPSGDDASAYNIYCETLSKIPSNATKIFTDGSETSEKLSGAFYDPSKQYEYSFILNPLLSIFSAEAAAILYAVEWAISNQFTQVLICSDSQSVLRKLCNFPGPNNLYPNAFIVKIMEKLAMSSQDINFHFLWVKAHSNIPGNNKADSIAKNTNVGTAKKDTTIVSSDFHPVIKKHLLQKWNQEWQKYGIKTNTYYYNIHPNIPMSQWYNNCHLSRKIISTISRIKMNHGKFPAHLFKIGVREDPYCPCGAIGDVNHFIFNCPLTELNSKIFLNFLYDNGFTPPIWLPHVLSLSNPNFMKKLSSFFFDSNVDI